MNNGSEANNVDSDDSEENIEGKKKRSWVYLHSEKRENKGKQQFQCLVEINSSGKICNKRVDASGGNTTTISAHLKRMHKLKPPTKFVQSVLSFDNNNMPKPKTFRQAFAELIAKQYLPYSLIEEKVLQDSYVTFHNEWAKNKNQPEFVTDKTVAADIARMAEDYIAEMKTRFKSKLSLSMDAWTGPNKMSFLGITFTYLDENFDIQRGLLEMVKMKEKHTGEYMAKLFQQALSLYGIDKDMVGGITQDNASNCGTCVEALVEDGFDRGLFYGCFLHVLNLACQAAIKVYDPDKNHKPVKRTVLTIFDDKSESEDSQDEEDPDFTDDEFNQYTEELEDVGNKSNAILRVSSLS